MNPADREILKWMDDFLLGRQGRRKFPDDKASIRAALRQWGFSDIPPMPLDW